MTVPNQGQSRAGALTRHVHEWSQITDDYTTLQAIRRVKLPLGLKHVLSPNCNLCDTSVPEDLEHALITCKRNEEVSGWLLQTIHPHIPTITPKKLILLDFGPLPSSHHLPLVWLTAQVLGNIWTSRSEKKTPTLMNTRAMLEAGISIMRKTRFHKSCKIIETLVRI